MASKGLRKTARALAGDAIPRAVVGRELQRRIVELGLNRNQAAAVVKDAASQMSRLMTGHLDEFSADRMVRMLTRLGSDVDVTITHHGHGRKRHGKVTVNVKRSRRRR